ncbi:PREDICTED: hematological and neurological expressed 1 protein isoform X2 [Gekko japonicus]|uniref:Hematological and neurological expressed 1 protein isoform X2 n=1 Tax=Gekko japonicus TaxID=146911 RepID=A0ABM1JXS3_GEKJA|nr:PREDICTED: hematological and neurological expressed 1 protein isoform X2 [Gekko japonicus]
MTTTTTFKGMDPNGRSSSRVLRPPGGGSNFSLSGFDEPKEQPVRRNKMASNIFGTPEENPPSWARSTAKSSDISESSEAPGSQRRKSTDAECGDYIDPKGGEVEVPENTDAEVETASGLSEEKPLPAAPVPSPVAPAPSRRNPPGGKSSLVLG